MRKRKFTDVLQPPLIKTPRLEKYVSPTEMSMSGPRPRPRSIGYLENEDLFIPHEPIFIAATEPREELKTEIQTQPDEFFTKYGKPLPVKEMEPSSQNIFVRYCKMGKYIDKQCCTDNDKCVA